MTGNPRLLCSHVPHFHFLRHSVLLLPGGSGAAPEPPPPRLSATEKVDSHERSRGSRSHHPSGRSVLFPLSPSGRQAAAWLRPSRQPVLLPLLLALRRSMSARESLSKAHVDLRPPGSLCRPPGIPDRAHKDKRKQRPLSGSPARGRIRAGGASEARAFKGVCQTLHRHPGCSLLTHAVSTPHTERRGERQNPAPQHPSRLQAPKQPRSSQPGPTISFRRCSL